VNSTFVTVTVVGLLAVLAPGPDFLIVTRNSLLHSKRVGLATAWGIVAGNIWWVGASLMGISVLVARTVVLFNALKWLSALYLIYLGLRAFLPRRNGGGKEDAWALRDSTPTLTTGAAFRTGVLTNALNPKCALFYVAFFSVVITPGTPIAIQCAYGLEIMFIAACWFSLLATLLSLESVRGGFKRFSLWLDRTTGAVFIAVGVKVALYRGGP
jgi:RhtB (resistance to homoserine/threonine) family protein